MTRTFEHRGEAWRVLGLQKYTFFDSHTSLYIFFIENKFTFLKSSFSY